MSSVFRAVQSFSTRYPITRGMAAYSILWPASNFCQQSLLREKYDFAEITRYGLFAGLYRAPMVYGWVKLVVYFIPGQSMKSILGKVLIEQIVYAPFAITTFLFGISLLEGQNDWDEMKLEWQQKFLPTYKMNLCIWPLVQTLNYAFVKERDRVPVLATVSFFWTMYLSYMKHLDLQQDQISQTEI